MKYGRLNRLFPITMTILAVALIGLSGCTESAGSSIVVPTFTEPKLPPIEITVEQLYQEYIANETAADAKYKGERLLFNEVGVEEVVSQAFYDGRAVEDREIINLYFITGLVKFKPQNFGIMQNIEEGYVLNIVGECRGLSKGFVIINDCWVESVIGDISTLVPEEVY